MRTYQYPGFLLIHLGAYGAPPPGERISSPAGYLLVTGPAKAAAELSQRRLYAFLSRQCPPRLIGIFSRR